MRRLFFALAFVCHLALYAQVDNYALRFSSDQGVANLGTLTTIKTGQNYTLQMWICPSRWNQGAALLRCGTFSIKLGRAHSLVINDGNEHFSVTTSALEKDTWAHLTLITDNSSTRLYINNTIAATHPARLELPCANYSLWLGGNYQGRIDEIRLWRTALSEDYGRYWQTTLNELNPSWGYLQAYWKLDQEQCPNIVDYRAKHHGTLSATGVSKEKVTDNDKFKYLINLAYGNIERFFDRTIDHQHYWLSNRISIIGATVNTDNGTASLYTPADNATLTAGAEILDSYSNRQGVLSLTTAEAMLRIPSYIIDGAGQYTFETWLYIEDWTEGAYIFRKENTAGTQGISLRLGNQESSTLILRYNGQDFQYANAAKFQRWFHLGFSVNAAASKPGSEFHFESNGTTRSIVAGTAASQQVTPTLPSLGVEATLGEGLVAKFDETMLFNANRNVSQMTQDSKSLPMPGEDKSMAVSEYYYMRTLYCYDNPGKPGFDSFSVQGFFNKMRSYTEGMRGVKFTLTVAANNFDNCLANATKRKSLAADIAAMGNEDEFDGVDLDFEWTYSSTGWNNIALLCQAIREKLKPGKILSVSPHKVSYLFPRDKMSCVDYFNFQCYGPGDRDLCSETGFQNACNLFVNHGYPKDKIILSYSTTTTSGYRGNTRDQNVAPAGYRYIYPEGSYDPSQNFIHNDAQDVDYWIAGFNQVVWRSQYAVDNQLGGIMYWDLGNDLPATHKHSMARGATYALASNVEKLVTSVTSAAPAPADDTAGPISTPDPEDQGKEILESQIITSLDEVRNDMAYNLVNANGLGTLCYNASSDFIWLGASSNSNFSQTIDINSPAAQWLLIKHDGLYYLYNLACGKFVEVTRFDVTSQASLLVDEAKPLEVTLVNGHFAFRTYTDQERGYLCASPQLSARPVCQWTLTDNGSQWNLHTAPNVVTTSYLSDALLKIDPSGVSRITDGQATGPLIDIQGRQVGSTTLPRGIYIRNGKKIISK